MADEKKGIRIQEGHVDVLALFREVEKKWDYGVVEKLLEALEKDDCPITLDKAKSCVKVLKQLIQKTFFESHNHLRILFLLNQFLANKEDVEAQYDLGRDYLYGSKVTSSSPKEAEKWLKKAAENGVEWAEYYLFNAYFGQHGFEQNLDEAAQQLDKMKRLSSSDSSDFSKEFIYSMGVTLRKALEVKNLHEERMSLYRLAAEENATSQSKYNLAMSFFDGKLEKLNPLFYTSDMESAKRWFKKAAKAGHADAKEMLVTHYRYDRNYFFKAAEKLPAVASQGSVLTNNSPFCDFKN